MDNLHDAVSAWFLGPRAENFENLKTIFALTLDDQKLARQTVYPNDPQAFITAATQETPLYKANIEKLKDVVKSLSGFLSQHSVPFWHPRYQAHMSSESTFPAVIGYLMTIMYNPNNVATEASPFTTLLEKHVGDQLCQMLGYNVSDSVTPRGWGHIACDGSVANLESIWAARNLKYYALSLKRAIEQGPDLAFLATDPQVFNIELCDGTTSPFLECSTWQLLNLRPETVLNIPQQLYDTYGISQSFLQTILDPYIIQTSGKDDLEKYFKIDKQPIYFVGTTKHYSWPKGAAITGIGKANVLNVEVDNAARMSISNLRSQLDTCLQQQKAVYAVVAIMGSTEQGAVDPVADIVKLRQEYQQKGLSFAIHCDGAWGGYFASMIRVPDEVRNGPADNAPEVPSQPISAYTRAQVEAYQYADSFTIDPHKSGYVPYPAGGLCYRDGRMRHLVTWTSPVVWRGGSSDSESMGIYGVEGSKPGAAPTAAYVSHEVIGLHQRGYGALLGEALFTSAMFYANWATMEAEELVVVPFSMLPSENAPSPDPQKIAAERDFIRKDIVGKSNEEITNNPEAWKKLLEIGSDTMINAFACNFKVNGNLNTDIVEANYLNQRIFQRTSISTPNDVVNERLIILTSTKLAQTDYKGCLDNYKKRLGLEGDGDLYILINVTMSPWPTTSDMLQRIVADFKMIAQEELQHVKERDQPFPDKHGFVMQGTDKVHLVHLPMFYMANHRWQVIISGDLPYDVFNTYKTARQQNPDHFFVLGNTQENTLMDLIKEGGSFEAEMFMGLPSADNKHLAGPFTLKNVHVVVNESLSTSNLGPYPAQMPFYLYGTSEQMHIDHLLLAAPDAQLNTDQISLKLDKTLSADQLANGVIAVFTDVHEASMQPFATDPKTSDDHSKFTSPNFSFAPNQSFNVNILPSRADVLSPNPRPPIAKGTLTLGRAIFADIKMINEDPGAANMTHAMRNDSLMHGKFDIGYKHNEGNDALVDGVPHLRNVTYSLAAPNTFGLAAEYPAHGDHVEAVNARKALINRSWREAWDEARGIKL
ncbi:Polyadenylation factor subunit 2 [Sphaceloma murrayae]|uniref:Polyadenylation factor subunit 2 n=1 Tax=Sphaceloma murrayae TaxID=2082308 RepID=A0A2K1QY78_9PEZI|nr:Polyadenylation factor subunit 2 [Sphaceloma murrayae]